MNGRTARLLRRYATKTKKSKSQYRALKDRWDRLSAEERRKARAEIQDALKAPEGPAPTA
ncbi:MAG: hypothetical protein L0216_08985 [Planctomycetales bacterium]|nr:hypothetical protein [Planctomycetales bacterium]